MKDEIIIEDFVDNDIIELEERMHMPVLENLTIIPSEKQQIFKSKKDGFDEVIVEKVEGDTLNITPTEENQNHKGLYNEVNIAPIPEEYIKPTGATEIKENGIVDVKEYEFANVNVIAKPLQSKGVDFIDYDGTLLYSYTVEEAQALTELPKLPTQQGLICQGWNWSLEDIKAQGTELIVGATYITDDGKTRLYIHIENDKRMDVPILFRQSIPNGVEIDWGDGSPVETFTNSGFYNVEPIHKYNEIGDYVITLNPLEGCTLSFYGYSSTNIMGNNKPRAYSNMLKKVEIGKNITAINEYTFYYCYSLEYITIPNTITNIGVRAFYYCVSLKNVIIPNNIGDIKERLFYDCYSLEKISIPNSVTVVAKEACYSCSSLIFITIPNSVIDVQESAFRYCVSLKGIIFSKNMTVLNKGVCQDCDSLDKVIISDGITTIYDYAFQNAYSLRMIKIPDSVINLSGAVLSSCYSLEQISIQNVSVINTYTFSNNSSLVEILLGDVTTIQNNSFTNCSSLALMDLSKCTQVPTLAAIFAISGIPTDCIFKVPDELYDEWIIATNWSTVANQIVKASEVA